MTPLTRLPLSKNVKFIDCEVLPFWSKFNQNSKIISDGFQMLIEIKHGYAIEIALCN